MPRKIVTNIDPDDVDEALLDTFSRWASFALGESSLGGETLKAPSGRMAAALRAETDTDGNVVAIYLNQEEVGAVVNDYLMYGHKRFSLKTRMLQPGAPGVHETKNKKGRKYLYRYIPISDTPQNPIESFNDSPNLVNLFTSETTSDGGILRLNRNAARVWAKNYERAHTKQGNHIVTMSNRPGSSRWMIPEMPAFDVKKLLRDMVPDNLKDKII